MFVEILNHALYTLMKYFLLEFSDYSCALQKDILLQGRIYLSENWLCFYSNIFRWETTVSFTFSVYIITISCTDPC